MDVMQQQLSTRCPHRALRKPNHAGAHSKAKLEQAALQQTASQWQCRVMQRVPHISLRPSRHVWAARCREMKAKKKFANAANPAVASIGHIRTYAPVVCPSRDADTEMTASQH